MVCYSITLPTEAAHLYEAVAKAAGRSTEQVLSDALYRLAGELSLEALQKPVPTLKAETPTVPFPAEHSSP